MALGTAAVAVCHFLALAPGRAAVALAGLMASAWLAAHESTDAWAAWQDQARWIASEPMAMARDLAVAQVDRTDDLVNLGLHAETGRSGLVGAWLMQNQRGPVVVRTLAVQRTLPGGQFALALAIAIRATLVALGVWRALRRLSTEPRCGRCGRYLRRTEVGRVDSEQLQQLAAAWAGGSADVPTRFSEGGPFAVFRDVCPRGHHVRAGLCAVRLRRRGWSAAPVGMVAELPPVLADNT